MIEIILVGETASTNSFMIEAATKDVGLKEGTVFYTLRQTAGRGQVGNRWESEDGKNIAFSLLLRPNFLPIKEQFLISEITCLAVAETLEQRLKTSSHEVSIKWPNDIYINNEKICGILIENSLMGSEIVSSVIGVGININQTQWKGGAPNPTSLKLCCGKDFPIKEILEETTSRLWEFYEKLKEGGKEEIHSRYLAHLYRRDGFHPYKDTASEQTFQARIKDVEQSGYLNLEDTEGATRRYMFKEVKFILPCGVTKE